MVSLGLAFNIENKQGYSAHLVFVAFVTLLFFFVTISQCSAGQSLKGIFLFLVSLAETMWLEWIGVSLNLWSALLWAGAVCAAWFFIHVWPDIFRQMRVVSRWNTAYAAIFSCPCCIFSLSLCNKAIVYTSYILIIFIVRYNRIYIFKIKL